MTDVSILLSLFAARSAVPFYSMIATYLTAIFGEETTNCVYTRDIVMRLTDAAAALFSCNGRWSPQSNLDRGSRSRQRFDSSNIILSVLMST
jgi:hypothetical protein